MPRYQRPQVTMCVLEALDNAVVYIRNLCVCVVILSAIIKIFLCHQKHPQEHLSNRLDVGSVGSVVVSDMLHSIQRNVVSFGWRVEKILILDNGERFVLLVTVVGVMYLGHFVLSNIGIQLRCVVACSTAATRILLHRLRQ